MLKPRNISLDTASVQKHQSIRKKNMFLKCNVRINRDWEEIANTLQRVCETCCTKIKIQSIIIIHALIESNELEWGNKHQMHFIVFLNPQKLLTSGHDFHKRCNLKVIHFLAKMVFVCLIFNRLFIKKSYNTDEL